MRLQNLADQQAELAIAQHGDRGATRDLHLIQNLAGGGQRLDEDGVLRWESRAGRDADLRSGSVRNSRNAPGCLTIPSTVRRGQ